MVSKSIDWFYKLKNMKSKFLPFSIVPIIAIGIATNNSATFIAVFVGLTIAFSVKNKHSKNDI